MLILENVSYTVAGRPILIDISMSLGPQRYGLVGPNGIGKTTLARIAVGALAPTTGRVRSAGSAHLLAQTEQRPPGPLSQYLLPLWDYSEEAQRAALPLLEGIDQERAAIDLSGGEWMRARLALAVAMQPGTLILDEPSNDLDRHGRNLLLQFVSRFTETLLIISHDRELLAAADRILELSNKGLSLFGGSFALYWDARTSERQRQHDTLQKLKKQAQASRRARAEALARQERRAKHGKQRAINRGDSRIIVQASKRTAQMTLGRIEVASTTHLEHAHAQVSEAWEQMKRDPFIRLDFESAVAPAGKVLVEASTLNWQFANAAAPLWDAPIDLTIRGGQRWQIDGRNGSGKSTLLRLLLGRVDTTLGFVSGTVRRNTIATGYLDQRYGELNPQCTVLENLSSASRFGPIELRNELAFYGFTDARVNQVVSSLSGGEILKANLAALFLGAQLPELLILDEPTNNLDITSLELLERALRAYQGALVVVSHDAAFVRTLRLEHVLELPTAMTRSCTTLEPDP